MVQTPPWKASEPTLKGGVVPQKFMFSANYSSSKLQRKTQKLFSWKLTPVDDTRPCPPHRGHWFWVLLRTNLYIQKQALSWLCAALGGTLESNSLFSSLHGTQLLCTGPPAIPIPLYSLLGPEGWHDPTENQNGLYSSYLLLTWGGLFVYFQVLTQALWSLALVIQPNSSTCSFGKTITNFWNTHVLTLLLPNSTQNLPKRQNPNAAPGALGVRIRPCMRSTHQACWLRVDTWRRQGGS